MAKHKKIAGITGVFDSPWGASSKIYPEKFPPFASGARAAHAPHRQQVDLLQQIAATSVYYNQLLCRQSYPKIFLDARNFTLDARNFRLRIMGERLAGRRMA